MTWHTVVQGESVATIAHANGLSDWRKVYDHPENASLREKRPQPELLNPGDRIFIPEKEKQELPVATTQKHRFTLKKPKSTTLRIAVKDPDDQALASKPYKLTLDETLVLEGTTDGEGGLEAEIPISAREGILEIEGYRLPLRLSHLDPIDEITGVKARLHNLGYDCGPIDGAPSEKMSDALRAFQKSAGIAVTGQIDAATKDKLREQHGC